VAISSPTTLTNCISSNQKSNVSENTRSPFSWK